MMPSPMRSTATKIRKSADCLNHAIAGTESAIATPRKLISKDRRLIPARKVPSASSIKNTKLFAGDGNRVLTLGNSMIFIMTKKVVQWSACVHINRT